MPHAEQWRQDPVLVELKKKFEDLKDQVSSSASASALGFTTLTQQVEGLSQDMQRHEEATERLEKQVNVLRGTIMEGDDSVMFRLSNLCRWVEDSEKKQANASEHKWQMKMLAYGVPVAIFLLVIEVIAFPLFMMWFKKGN